jgi:hypothetical protein
MNFQGFYNSKLKDIPKETYTLEDIKNNLTNRGWNYFGSGAFASVFVKKDTDYVIKIYKNDKAYDRYLEFLENNQDNPHAPKILKKLKFPSDNENEIKMVVMERLVPVNPKDWRVKTAEVLENILGSINPYDTEEGILFILKDRVEDYDWFNSKREEKKIKRRIDYFLETNLDLIRFLINYTKFLKRNEYLKSTRFDLHDKNYMIRPSTGEVVITDPSVYDYDG